MYCAFHHTVSTLRSRPTATTHTNVLCNSHLHSTTVVLLQYRNAILQPSVYFHPYLMDRESDGEATCTRYRVRHMLSADINNSKLTICADWLLFVWRVNIPTMYAYITNHTEALGS